MFKIFAGLFFSIQSVYGLETGVLNQLLDRYHLDHSMHGHVVILDHGQEVFSYTAGFANQEFEVPHSRKSKFMIASLSKQFTAASILKLEAEGKIKVSDLVSEHIELPWDNEFDSETLQRWNQLTIKQLLNHTSGLKRDVTNGDRFNIEAYDILQDVVDSQLRKPKLINRKLFIADPGDKFYYSNLGYVLLAQIIYNKGSLYDRYLNLEIFSPLQMIASGEFHRGKFIKNMTTGYFYSDDYNLSKRCCVDASTFVGSHSLYSNIDDLIIWMNELFYKNSVLSKKIVSKMVSAQLPPGLVDGVRVKNQYGYGFNVDSYNGLKRIWHDGHEMGFVSLMSHLPSINKSIIILSNRHGIVFEDLFHHKLQNEIIDLLLEDKAVINQ